MNRQQISTLLCTLLASAAMQAQTIYLETSFDEGMPEGFATYDLDQRTPDKDMQKLGFEVGKGWIVAQEGHEGNLAAMATSFYKDSGAANDWLITPALSITSEKAVLRWRSRAQAQDFPDGLKVYIGTQGNTPQHFADAEPVFSVAKENYQWTDHEVSLAGYTGQTVYVAFVNDSKDKQCIIVDDIFAGVPSTVGFALDFGRCYNGYGRMAISGTATATTNDDIDGFTIGFRTAGQTIEQHFDATLRRGTDTPFCLSDSIAIGQQESIDYDAWIKAGPDSIGLSSRVTALPWRVVAEEMTGTWCAWCVRGIGAMQHLRTLDPQHFIGIAIHNNSEPGMHPDSMAIKGEEYLKWVMHEFGLTGFPSFVMNRRADYSGDPSSMVDGFGYVLKTNDYDTGVMLKAAVYDEETGLIETTTSVYPTRQMDGSGLRLFYVVIENDVHRTYEELGVSGERSGYDQRNAYAGREAGACYGFEDLPSVIPADDMWYQEVARGTEPATDFKGVKGLLPDVLEAETSYDANRAFAMPATVLRKENTEVVVMLIGPDGRIMNADVAEVKSKQEQSGISSAKVSTPTNALYYDLRGLPTTAPRHGLYVRDGRKVIF